MNNDKRGLWVLTIIGSSILFFMLLSGVLFIVDKPIVGAIIATFGGSVILLFIVLLTIGVTAWWTRETMKDGADVALRANEINDTWDARKVQAYGAFGKAIIGMLGQSGKQALPPPSDGWDMPVEVKSFEEVERD